MNGTFCDEVRSILNDVKSIRDGQNSSESILGAIQLDNKSLWRDVAVLRNQHHKQRRVIEKLIQFLLSLIQSRNNIVKKRKGKLMIAPSSCTVDGGGGGGGAPNGAPSQCSTAHMGAMTHGTSINGGNGAASATNGFGRAPDALACGISLADTGQSSLGGPVSSHFVNLCQSAINEDELDNSVLIQMGGLVSGKHSQQQQQHKQEQQQQQYLTTASGLNGQPSSSNSANSFAQQQSQVIATNTAPDNDNININGATDTEMGSNGYQTLQFANGAVMGGHCAMSSNGMSNGSSTSPSSSTSSSGGAGGNPNNNNNNGSRGGCHHATQWTVNSIYNTMANEASVPGANMNMFSELRMAPGFLSALETGEPIGTTITHPGGSNNGLNNGQHQRDRMNGATNTSNNNNNNQSSQHQHHQLQHCFYN